MSDYKQINYPLSVAWDSTVRTGNFTAEKTLGYFVNTTAGQITVTLPASPSVGDQVAIKDYAGTFGTNSCVIAGNGANIQGSAADSALKTNRGAAVLVYVDSTKGWIYQQQSNASDNIDVLYVSASGGTETTSGDWKIHTFNSSGTFTVNCAGNASGSNTVDYMVVAAGGSGGYFRGGGGGAGGFRESVPSPAAWSASPLANPGGSLPVSVTAYPVTVGGGGASVTAANRGNNGNPSVFSTITSAGGGGGGGEVSQPGANAGGSGGGRGGGRQPPGSGGAGNTPPTSPPQGNPGGAFGPGGPTNNGDFGGAGGGGAGGAGPIGGTCGTASPGAPGVSTSITGGSVTRAGGGGGAANAGSGGGSGGGGASASPGAAPGPKIGNAGSGNTGGGGGAGPSQSYQCAPPYVSGAGGSGVVVIRYKFQN